MSTVVDDGEAQSSPRFSDADQQMYNITFRPSGIPETERQSSSERRQNQSGLKLLQCTEKIIFALPITRLTSIKAFAKMKERQNSLPLPPNECSSK